MSRGAGLVLAGSYVALCVPLVIGGTWLPSLATGLEKAVVAVAASLLHVILGALVARWWALLLAAAPPVVALLAGKEWPLVAAFYAPPILVLIAVGVLIGRAQFRVAR